MIAYYLPRTTGKTKIEKDYIESLNNHIMYVREAGYRLGVNHEQLIMHDNSKWSDQEFYAYAMHFHGGGAPELFAKAWLHHLHHNPHHWEHWLIPTKYTLERLGIDNFVIQMPDNYALEMLADWIGASMAYKGTGDIGEWLWNNIEKITVHSKTADFLTAKLREMGYSEIVEAKKFDVRIESRGKDIASINISGVTSDTHNQLVNHILGQLTNLIDKGEQLINE